MATYNEAVTIINDRFISEWAAFTAFTFENLTFTPPAFNDTDPIASSWVRLSVRETAWRQETMGPVGARNFLRKGLAILQIFTPSNEGTKTANDLADKFKDSFEGVTDTGVRFHEVTRVVVGQEGRWFQINASAVFDYTERR